MVAVVFPAIFSNARWILFIEVHITQHRPADEVDRLVKIIFGANGAPKQLDDAIVHVSVGLLIRHKAMKKEVKQTLASSKRAAPPSAHNRPMATRR